MAQGTSRKRGQNVRAESTRKSVVYEIVSLGNGYINKAGIALDMLMWERKMI